MSVLDGPGEGTWSVFAQKVVEERDELRHKLAGEAAHIKSLEDLLVDAVRERDALKQRLDELPAMYREDIESLDSCVERLGAENTKLRAEVEMLRGVGCREAKAGEPESGPCGVCLRCAEERGAKWAIVAVRRGDVDAYWNVSKVAEVVCVEARKGAKR